MSSTQSSDKLDESVPAHRKALYLLMRRYVESGKPLLLRSEIVEAFNEFVATPQGRQLEDAPIAKSLRSAQEGVVRPPFLYLAVRPRIARWQYLQIQLEDAFLREVPVSEYLGVKDAIVDGEVAPERWPLEVDLRPFSRGFPRMKEARSIGRGVEFMNRYLSGRMFDKEGTGPERLFEFLRVHQVGGRQLMVNGGIENVAGLERAVRRALDRLEGEPDETPWNEIEPDLRELGFEVGWGRDARRIREMMGLLSDVLEAASPETLARLLGRLPMIFDVVILSPHGYFGQAGVLGKPDTGGQVVYILDQVRALERRMRRTIHRQGLDVTPNILVVTRLLPEAEGTTCDRPVEPISGTENARIVRVPFRTAEGEVVPQWISRFEIWPYLERFAVDCEREIVATLGGRPDLIVGNYSDGNLVASLLSRSLGVTQCNIAHALEKTKYLHSDLYWKEHDPEHHFACQFTADLISMTAADFIITSTYQEIAGTKESIGQYESHASYTLPGLYRVVAGADPHDPRFNIVSPGADPDVFFPYWEEEQRLEPVREHIHGLLFGDPGPSVAGRIDDRERPILMAMSRLDRIKNMAGFVEWYARNESLRGRANLLVVGGFIDPAKSEGADERRQIEQMHDLFERYGLEGQARWIEMQTDKNVVGELYRCVADTRGGFVQPALFEAFGLTVVEAMVSGLPTFATCYGGPLEIIEDGISGFHIDPNHGDRATGRMNDLFAAAEKDPVRWETVSRGGVERVETRYTWKLYADRMLRLARIYGFWKFMTNIERQETRRYLEMLYTLMYRPLAEAVGSDS